MLKPMPSGLGHLCHTLITLYMQSPLSVISEFIAAIGAVLGHIAKGLKRVEQRAKHTMQVHLHKWPVWRGCCHTD